MPVTYQYLTDRTLIAQSAITTDTLIHVVNTNDTSQNPDGSSYKAKLSQLLPGLSGLTFTGNTLLTCISDIYVSNIHSCSPLLVNPNNEGNVYFGSTSGITLDLTNKRIGINTNNPQFNLHVSGTTNITGTLTSNSISATTYLNLPTTTNGYLPLSGGTVTGGTIFTSGVTANTISNTTYIDFNTGSTNPSTVAGRVFFDNSSEALSYYYVGTSSIPIAMGQQLYVRGNNATGSQINKGSVVMVTGTTNTLPSIALATNNHTQGSPRPIGLAAENIPNGSEGLVINNGILSGITINSFANGTTLYLSDTTPGGYVGSTSSLSFSARTNEIGYVLQTGTTTGKIYVNINNEDSNLTLTDIERNILEGNVISTGIYEYTGMSVASSTTINVAPARGWIVNNTYNFATSPDVTNLYYSGGTGITMTNIATADATYILLTSASTITQQTTFPTPQQRRENILLGKVVHPSRTSILNVNNTVDFDVSPMSALRDLWTPIRLINQGVIPSANTGLTINTTAGTLWGNGIGWVSNQLNPDSVSISAKTPASFFYRTQTGGTSGSVSVIDPTKYDVGGVITSMGAAGADDSSNQRIYLYPTGVINILYGQHKYNNLAAAVAAIQSETFVVYPNAETTGILIGVLSVRNDIVADGEALTNTDYAKFTLVSKFGESFGGTGGLSTTTLQQAYNNSVTPEITTNSTLGPLSVKNGAGTLDNVTNVFEGVNAAGTTTSYVRADGAISGTSFSGNSLDISGNNSSSLVTITQTGSGNAFVVEDSSRPDSSPFVIDTSGNTGIGTTTPTAKLHIKGIDSSSSNISLKVEDSSNRNILSARNDNFVYVGDNSVSSYLWTYGLGGQFGFSNEGGFPYLFLNSSWAGGKFYFSNGSSGSGAFAQINTTNGNWLLWSPNTGVFSSTLTDTKLTVIGVDAGTSNFGLKVQDSGGTNNFLVRNDGRVGVGTGSPSEKLHVSGNTLINGSLTANTFSGSSDTISGTKGTITTSGSSTTALLTFSGSGTVGGTGYTDFIRVTNTAAGATTPSKTFRTDIFGSFEIINNAYNSTLLSLTDAGNLTVAGRVKSTINYSQTGGGASVTLGASASPQTILSLSITTYGNPVMICAYGDAENTGAGYWCTLQLWRDSTQIGAIVHAEGSAGSENIPFAMTYYDAPAAGTYTYYLKANQVTGGNFKFGESTAPILNAREL